MHVLLAVTLRLSTQAQPLPTSEDSRGHLTADLMKFWMHRDAQGQQRSAFLSTRCEDGTAVHLACACPMKKTRPRKNGEPSSEHALGAYLPALVRESVQHRYAFVGGAPSGVRGSR